MTTEKNLTPASGFTILTIQLVIAVAAVLLFLKGMMIPIPFAVLAIVLLSPGFIINNPNEAKVLTFFGKYIGTAKGNGFLWVNPFSVKRSVTLRMRNLNGNVLKVNDKLGNPIEIAAVIANRQHLRSHRWYLQIQRPHAKFAEKVKPVYNDH